MANKSSNKSQGTAKRVPRACLPVNIIEEAVYWALVGEGVNGMHAWGVITALNMLAKRQKYGEFSEPLAVLSARIGINLKELQRAIEMIETACRQCEVESWIEINSNGGQGRLHLCIYEQWNPTHGGKRDGSGRPGKSSGNQDVQLDYSLNNKKESGDNNLIPKVCAPESESESSSETYSLPSSESEPEDKASAKSLNEPEERAESATGSQEKAPWDLDSDSGSPERQHAWVAWAIACTRLVGKLPGGKKHPLGSMQSLADVTSVKSLFRNYVWPIELSDVEGVRRMIAGLKLVDQAGKNANIPMAWLTKMCKKHLPCKQEACS